MNKSALVSAIKVAITSKNLYCLVPYTKLNLKILEKLLKEGYLYAYSLYKNKDNKTVTRVKLKHFHNKPVLQHIKIISKPGNIIYWDINDIKKYVLSKKSIKLIISSNKGIITSDQALNEKIGGEILLEYY